MNWELQKYVTAELINYIRRIFTYQSQWNNTDIEIVDLKTYGSGSIAYEQFFEDNETYPIVVVASMGGNYEHTAINQVVQVNNNTLSPLGVHAYATATISASQACALAIPACFQGETIRGIQVLFASQPIGVPGEDINVTVYSNYTTLPIAIGSGSITGTDNLAFNFSTCNFYDFVTIPNSDAWIVFSTVSGSVYSIAIDPSVPGLYQGAAT